LQKPPSEFSLKDKRVWVAGHRGMVGSAVVERLQHENCTLLTATHNELDLTQQHQVDAWLAAQKPDVIVLAAAKVGGILANSSTPADFIYTNLMIEANVIHAAYRQETEKLLFLGSSCIYPRGSHTPISENALLSGPLEPTNEWYAVAKITGIKLCQAYRRQHGCDFISAMPCNLYGPNDNFDLASSHVLPALIAKVHAAHSEGAESVDVWGSGQPKREFMYVTDLADGLVFLLKHYSDEQPINIGSGTDISINELCKLIFKTIGYKGKIKYNNNRPDGVMQKTLDVSRLTKLGWQATTPLDQGISLTYQHYLKRYASCHA